LSVCDVFVINFVLCEGRDVDDFLTSEGPGGGVE
jgi:hypothetical protein